MYWHVGKKQLQMVIYKTKVLERNITNKQTKANSKYDIKKHNYNRLIKMRVLLLLFRRPYSMSSHQLSVKGLLQYQM